MHISGGPPPQEGQNTAQKDNGKSTGAGSGWAALEVAAEIKEKKEIGSKSAKLMSMLSTATPPQAPAPQQQAILGESRSALLSMLSPPGTSTHGSNSQIESSSTNKEKRLIPSHLLTKRKP